MPTSFRHLPGLAWLLLLGLSMLCVLVKPVMATAHEIHEASHALTENTGTTTLTGEQDQGPLDSALHLLDCCLHASVLMPEGWYWPPAWRAIGLVTFTAKRTPSIQHGSLLRPPIPA